MNVVRCNNLLPNTLILLLLLISTHSGNAQELYGSFGTASRFYVKCAPFEGEKLIREGIEDFEKISILKERLKDSDDSHNMVAYNLLLRKIDEFTASSGESAKIDELVESAQDFLKLLARKQF